MQEVLQNALELLKHTWGPLVEILVFCVAIYFLLKFVRATRGAGILRGLFVLIMAIVLVLFVTGRMHGAELGRLNWLLERTLSLGLIGVIILFQPEIRRALMKLGQTPVLDIFGKRRPTPLDQVVEAVRNMSRKKVGALIALQREVALSAYIEAGVQLDADVTSELLGSIFMPGGPLHDGAVIIRNGRVAAAGSLLPLSENPEISKSVGTRHRAAVGLSEESDAVVVVVSEEDSRISVAVNGELLQGISPADLRPILENLCEEAEVETAA